MRLDAGSLYSGTGESSPRSAVSSGPIDRKRCDLPLRHDLPVRIVWAKRTFDVAVVLAAAPIVLLLIAAAALAIWASEGRPVFYLQDRVGLRGRTFRILKLRTMRRDGPRGPVSATACDDPRITLVGSVLRRYRIDELPQFVNVLRGEMSLIGPRPEQPALVEQYKALLPGFEERHLVKPGITGLAQVMYGYASTVEETRKKVRYDRFYVRHCSIALDWVIVAKTIRTLLWPLRVR